MPGPPRRPRRDSLLRWDDRRPERKLALLRRLHALVDVASPTDRRQLVNGRLAYLSQVLVDQTLLGGGSVVLRNSFDAGDTLATIEAERITDLFLVEPQLAELLDHPDLAVRDLSSLRVLTHIGASAPPTLRRRARQRLGAKLAHSYGASEVGIVSTLSPAEYDPARPEASTSAGRINPGVQLRLRRRDGELAAPGRAGSIEIRSPAMAGGYRNRPAEQATAFVDGWYRTGDLGRIDPGGYLHILGCAVDVAGSEAPADTPAQVEDTLCRATGVNFAVVVVDHESDRWIAAVTAQRGATVDPDACRAAVAAAHGHATAARTLVLPLPRIPLTEQGNPDRPFIRRLSRTARAYDCAPR